MPRPWKPFSSLSALSADERAGFREEGATAGAETAFENIANPANFITKPIGEIGQAAGSVVADELVAVSRTASHARRQERVRRRKTAATGSNSERPRPLKKAADDFNSSLKKFADSLHKKAPAAPENDDDTE